MAPRPRAGRRRPWRGGGRHHQARQPVRRGCRRRPGHRLRAGAQVRRAVRFGGIVAIGGPVDEAVAEAIAAGPQADVIIAPSYAPTALAQLASRRKAPACSKHRALSPSSASCGSRQCCARPGARPVRVAARELAGGHQDHSHRRTVARPRAGLAGLRADHLECHRHRHRRPGGRCGCRSAVSGGGRRDRREQGGGAGERRRRSERCILPLPDGLEVLARAGVGAVVQPGGSVRDAEVIAAADEAGVAMVLTGERHFRH